MPNWSKIVHFRPDEFGRGEPGVEVSQELLDRLDVARAHAGVPFQITRGLSTHEHNEAVGGVPSSAHVEGYAVDISAPDSSRKFSILSGLIFAGFTRIGVYKHHIHADVDPHKPHNVIWVGE